MSRVGSTFLPVMPFLDSFSSWPCHGSQRVPDICSLIEETRRLVLMVRTVLCQPAANSTSPPTLSSGYFSYFRQKSLSGVNFIFWFLCSALRRLRGCEVQSSELDEILQEQAETKGMRASHPWELFTDRSVRWQLISVMIISSAMQLCGNDSVRRNFIRAVIWEMFCVCSGCEGVSGSL